MSSQVLHMLIAQLRGDALSGVPADGPRRAAEPGNSMGSALLAAERADSKDLVTAIGALNAEDRDVVLRNVVVRALAHDSGLPPLLAMTMLFPRRADLHLGLGFAHLARESHASAHRSFRCALALDANSVMALFGCGVALQNLGQPALAAELLNRAWKRDKNGQAGRAAATVLLRLLDDTDAPRPTPSARSDDALIPYVPGTAHGIFLY